MLSDLENFVANAIVTTSFRATVVAEVEGVVAESVEGLLAVGGTTVSGFEKGKAQTISHRRPKGSGIQIERERRGWECVQPVTGVREANYFQLFSIF